MDDKVYNPLRHLNHATLDQPCPANPDPSERTTTEPLIGGLSNM